MVRKEGVDPPRPCGHRILSPARLPVPPLPRSSYYTKESTANHAWIVSMRKNTARPRSRSIGGISLLELFSFGFRKSQRQYRPRKKRPSRHEERQTQRVVRGQHPQHEGRRCGDASTDVVAQPHGGRANLAGKQFPRDGPEPREKSTAKKPYPRATM